MITDEEILKLKKEFGLEHPEYTTVRWMSSIMLKQYRLGYWEYVRDMMKKYPLKNIKNQNNYSTQELEVLQESELKNLRNLIGRGFTDQELAEYIEQGNSYADAEKKFNKSADTISKIYKRYKKKQKPLLILNKLLIDFINEEHLSIRSTNILRCLIPKGSENSYTVGDMIQEGVLHLHTCGPKSRNEIKYLLIEQHSVPHEIFPIGKW